MCLLAALLLFANLHRGDLAGFDDAVYAHEAREMLQTGDWLNVRLNGRLDFDKPPLYLWLEVLSLRAFGLNDFAAKFPAALLGLGTILLVYGIARELTAERRIALWAMLVLTSTQYFLKYATHAMTDVPFTFFFTLAVWAYLRALNHAPHWLYLCGAAIGAGILIRSVLGLLVVGVIVGHLVVLQRFDRLRTTAWWIGALLAFGLPMIWFAPQYYWHGPQFLALHFSFTRDNLASIQPAERHWLSGLLHYPFLLLKLYWPWWPVLCAGLVLAVRRAWQQRETAAWLLLLWVFVVVAPFSLIE
ncbi:MAG: glycosyltransferase family 39 protein, partial [Acidobacteriota bacterium]|nr:glycosyltransferase family 39 protein [Acidobacteriota bacterium]